jgi:hypothetical protein
MWLAGASLFSGRRDPTWEVPPAIGASLVRRFEELPAAGEEEIPKPPRLGYRGSWLRAPDGREWRAYGRIAIAVGGTRADRRRDSERDFERRILETAPAGMVPAGLV